MVVSQARDLLVAQQGIVNAVLAGLLLDRNTSPADESPMLVRCDVPQQRIDATTAVR